jgi:hypothetical protein
MTERQHRTSSEGSPSDDLDNVQAHIEEALLRAQAEAARLADNVRKQIGKEAVAKTVEPVAELAPTPVSAPTPSVPQTTLSPTRPAPRQETQASGSSYSAKIGELTSRYDMSDRVQGGPALVRLEPQPNIELPLQITRDNRPMRVLSTISVGNERGGNNVGASGSRLQTGIESALRNYAVVRDPETSQTFLMGLRADEIAAGRSDYESTPKDSTQPPDQRDFLNIPPTGLNIEFPFDDTPYEQPAGFSIKATMNDLVVDKTGYHPDSYVYLAHEV